MIDRRPSGQYRVRVYYRQRYITSRTFSRRRDAERWEREAKDALAAGRWFDSTKHDAVTVDEWAKLWLASKMGGKPSAVVDRERFVRVHVSPAFGRKPLGMIAHSDVAAWARGLAMSHSASTARGALGALRGTFDLAMRDGAIQTNPTLGIKLPASQAGEPHPLTHEQLWKLADAMPGEKDRLLVLVAGYSGLRWGELTALRPADVRADGTLRIIRAWSEVKGVLHLGDVKSHQARTVPLPRTVSRALAQWTSKLDCDAFVFHSSTPTTPLRNGNYRSRVLDRAVASVGITDFTPHCFRDTAASLALQAGATVSAVSKMLGHRDASTTLKHYASMFPTELDDLAARLDRRAAELSNNQSVPAVSNGSTDHIPTN
ncbi:tyrosine-type recombinase/integrase [Microbacterium amylolyticum]|uniref:Integrase n=1 Tax=Microbacterium amylolyticum TaxID=936337 RepID=A0ABS4ZIX7_9MICO|nr:site-specific integrase [Microbacterium amylolyticum]MBP2437242.1 integrase [Microbacterium amylolyticum]